MILHLRLPRRFLLAAIFFFGLTPVWAQAQSDGDPPKTSAAEPPAPPAKNPPDADGAPPAPIAPAPDKKQTNATSKDRLFYALPNFLTLENAHDVPPLTVGQKFAVVARGSFDPVQYFWIGSIAGLSQLENSEPRYGQGVAGYAKRYAVRFADGTVENFMAQAVFPSILHQDPRYFQSGKGGVWHRVYYAATRIFITRGDSGRRQFNYSEVFGAATAAGISTYTYHLKNEQNLGSAASVYGTQLLYDSLGYIVKEFWPDLRHKMQKNKVGQGHKQN